MSIIVQWEEVKICTSETLMCNFLHKSKKCRTKTLNRIFYKHRGSFALVNSVVIIHMTFNMIYSRNIYLYLAALKHNVYLLICREKWKELENFVSLFKNFRVLTKETFLLEKYIIQDGAKRFCPSRTLYLKILYCLLRV